MHKGKKAGLAVKFSTKTKFDVDRCTYFPQKFTKLDISSTRLESNLGHQSSLKTIKLQLYAITYTVQSFCSPNAAIVSNSILISMVTW
jgi:hypothetical protein